MNATVSPSENALIQCVLMKQQAAERFRTRFNNGNVDKAFKKRTCTLVRVSWLIATWTLVRIYCAENGIFNWIITAENTVFVIVFFFFHFPNWKARVKNFCLIVRRGTGGGETCPFHKRTERIAWTSAFERARRRNNWYLLCAKASD